MRNDEKGGGKMSSKARQDKILEILEKQGHVTVKYLTEVLEVAKEENLVYPA